MITYIFRNSIWSRLVRMEAKLDQLILAEKKELLEMTVLDDAISTLNTEVTKISGAVTNAVNDIAGLQKQIADLQAQLNSGAPVTQAQLDALNAASASLDTIANNLAAAAPAPTPAPAP